MSLNNSTKPRPLAKILEAHGFTQNEVSSGVDLANLSKMIGSNSALGSGNAKQPVLQGPSQCYIDPMDLALLDRKQRIDQLYFKQTISRWMNIAWDSFRIVDNNTNNVIFMLPDDPCSSEFREYAAKVKNPTINLQTIRQKLTYRYYNSLDEFVDEMLTLFDNWVDLKGKGHKMHTQCDNMRKRFEKFIEKNRNKYASGGSSVRGQVRTPDGLAGANNTTLTAGYHLLTNSALRNSESNGQLEQ